MLVAYTRHTVQKKGVSFGSLLHTQPHGQNLAPLSEASAAISHEPQLSVVCWMQWMDMNMKATGSSCSKQIQANCVLKSGPASYPGMGLPDA